MTHLNQYIIDPILAYDEMFPSDGEPALGELVLGLSQSNQEILQVLSALSSESVFDFNLFQKQLQPLLVSFLKENEDISQSALFLGELLLEFGAGSNQTSLFQLMAFDQVVDSVLDFMAIYSEEKGTLNKQIDFSQTVLKKVRGSYLYFNCFKSYASLWSGLKIKQKELEELDLEVKSLELRIRDLNKKIKELKMMPFIKDGKEQDFSQFGEIEEVQKKLKDAKIKMGFEDAGSEKHEKYTKLVAMLEADLELFEMNESLQSDKDLMKENVKKWGLEAKAKKEKLQDLRDEVNVEGLVAHRRKKIDTAKMEGSLEKAFCEKLEKLLSVSSEEGAGFGDEMISVAAAVRLAEAMKSQMVMPSMGAAPVVNVTNMGGSSGGGQPAADMSFANKPLKPDFDYTNRDKDSLIQLIYDCDDKGMRFEKSAETLEALVYKSPSKAAQLMIDQGVKNQVFYLR